MALSSPPLSPAARAALTLMQHALAMLDRDGAATAACHLQWAIDVLTGAPIASADELAELVNLDPPEAG